MHAHERLMTVGACAAMAAGAGTLGCSSGSDTAPDVPVVHTSCVADPEVEPVDAFPYWFTDDDPATEHLLYRAEGHSFEENAAHIVEYALKAGEKRKETSSAEAEYFEAQRQLAAHLRGVDDPPDPSAAVVVGFVGDIMWLRDGWDTFVDADLLARMQAPDAWIGNLESPIAASFEVPNSAPDYPDYNSAPGLVQSFARDGGGSLFDALNFANNHTLDRDDQGAEETLAFLDQEGIASTGAMLQGEPRWVSFEVGGIQIGYYGAGWGLNHPELLETTSIEFSQVPGLAPLCDQEIDLSEIRDVMSEMDAAGVDFKVVGLHWGYEYEMYPDPMQVIAAREVIQAGADALVGHHPHVQQPAEICFVNGYESKYAGGASLAALGSPGGCILSDDTGRPRKGLVLYSLGNFASAMGTFLNEVGIFHELSIFRTADGSVDWKMPSHTFVYNLRNFPPEDEHHLVLLQAYVQGDCLGDGCTAIEADLSYLRSHLASDRGLEVP